MSALVRILSVVVLVELVVGGGLAVCRLARPEPPLADLSTLDPITAGELRAVRDKARDGSFADWRTLGQAYMGFGYYPEAEQCLRYAVRLKPDNLQSVYALAFCLERVGKTSEAVPHLKRAAELAVSSPSDTHLARTCWYQIGLCYLREENAAEAEAAFRRIVEAPAAAYHLARLLICTDRAAEAAQLLDVHLSQYPNSLKLLQLRAQAAEAMPDRHTARRFHDRVRRADFQITLHSGIRYISMIRNRYGLARRIDRCTELDSRGTLAERRNCLNDVLQLVRAHRLPQYPELFKAAARVELERHRPDDALDRLDEATKTGLVFATTQELRGDAWFQKGDDARAAAFWERAVSLRPFPELHQKLAQLYRLRDEPAPAKYHEVLQYQLQGIRSYRHNDPDQAREQLKRSLDLAPNDPRSWYYLAATYRVSGKVAQALEAYRRCLELDPNFQRARVEMQWLPTPP